MENSYIGNMGLVSCVSGYYEGQCEGYGLIEERSMVNYLKIACLQAINESKLNKEQLNQSDLYTGSSLNHFFEKSSLSDELFFKLHGFYETKLVADLASSLNIGGEITFFQLLVQEEM